MSASNYLEDQILDLILNNDDVANVGDATGLRGSSTDGNLYVALHTADPGEGGSQTTSEATYGSYQRIAVARTGAAWTITGGVASNAADIEFDECTSGSNSITYVSIGTASSGAGNLLFIGQLNNPITVSTGVTPKFIAGNLDITCT